MFRKLLLVLACLASASLVACNGAESDAAPLRASPPVATTPVLAPSDALVVGTDSSSPPAPVPTAL
ncbi:MAG: hypothetical protein OXL33_06845, partial [Chloroflexota bacterium]|nr:hypothetical protein [Chloroflexota bacterium]